MYLHRLILFNSYVSYITFVENVVSSPFQLLLPPNGLTGGAPQSISVPRKAQKYVGNS